MSSPVAHREGTAVTSDAERPSTAFGEFPPEVLLPLLEGARARGMADAFELVGIAAVLIDGTGEVLHVGASAAARMEAGIAVASRHLVGADSASNRALQELVAAALAGETKSVKLELVPAVDGLSVRALPVPGGRDNPFQLMKAVVVFDDAPKPIDEPSRGD